MMARKTLLTVAAMMGAIMIGLRMSDPPTFAAVTPNA